MTIRGDSGALSTELAVLTPILIAFVLFVVYAGRTVQAEADVQHAAYEAARTATLTATPEAAAEAAETRAEENLTRNSVSCVNLTVAVDTSEFGAGGHVTVSVSCVTTFADLVMLAVPGTRTITRSATSVVDTHRADP